MTYQGMPLSGSCLQNKDFDPVIGRVASRSEPWRARFTSKRSKTVLIDACLSSLPMYHMGLFLLPEGVHGAFDWELARFFWQGLDGRQKYHMVKWADMCLPRELAGLLIISSRRMNDTLMLWWVWRILCEDGGLWLQLIKAKYLRGARCSPAKIVAALSSGGPFRRLNLRSAWAAPFRLETVKVLCFGLTRVWTGLPFG